VKVFSSFGQKLYLESRTLAIGLGYQMYSHFVYSFTFTPQKQRKSYFFVEFDKSRNLSVVML